MKLDFKYIEQALLDYNTKSEYKQASIIMLRNIFKEAENKQCDIPVVVRSKTKPKRTLGDFDVWYKPCTRCGYDTGKSTKPKYGNKTCWKCGNFVQRDYTDRALKK